VRVGGKSKSMFYVRIETLDLNRLRAFVGCIGDGRWVRLRLPAWDYELSFFFFFFFLFWLHTRRLETMIT